WRYFGGLQPPFTAKSPANRIFTATFSGAGENTFAFVTPGQVFEGAWFSGYSFAPVHFNLYAGGVLVHTTADLTPSDVPTFLPSGYAGPVDAVGVYSGDHQFFVMDDVTYQKGGGPVAVPEPATLTLLGVGVAALAGCAWRRRKQAKPAA